MGRRVNGGDQKRMWRVGVAEDAARLQEPGQSSVRVSVDGCDCRGNQCRKAIQSFEEEEMCWKK